MKLRDGFGGISFEGFLAVLAAEFELLSFVNKSNRFPQGPQCLFRNDTVWKRIWLHRGLFRRVDTGDNGKESEGQSSSR
jgi:hypothetical protein